RARGAGGEAARFRRDCQPDRRSRARAPAGADKLARPEMTMSAASAESLAATLESDGFVVVPDFFDPELVGRARDEIDAWYRRDREERRSRNGADTTVDGVAG